MRDNLKLNEEAIEEFNKTYEYLNPPKPEHVVVVDECKKCIECKCKDNDKERSS